MGAVQMVFMYFAMWQVCGFIILETASRLEFYRWARKRTIEDGRERLLICCALWPLFYWQIIIQRPIR